MSRTMRTAKAAARRLAMTAGLNQHRARAVYDRLPISVRAAVRRTRDGDRPWARQPMTVTVVVPVRGPADAFAGQLRAVANQTYTRLEILAVALGAAESGHVQLAEEWARRDRRVRLLRTATASDVGAMVVQRSAAGAILVLGPHERWRANTVAALVAGLGADANASQHASTDTGRALDLLLAHTLVPYLAEPTWGDPDHRAIIEGLAHAIRPRLTAAVRSRLDVRSRIALYALESGSEQDFATVTLAHRDLGSQLPTAVNPDGTVTLVPPYPQRITATLPAGSLTLADSELAAEHAITRLTWRDGSLRLTGWAFARHIDLATAAPRIRVYLHHRTSGRTVDLVVAPRHEQVSRWVGSRWPNYDAGAFAAVLPSSALAAVTPGRYELRLAVTAAGRHRDIPVSNLRPGGSAPMLDAGTAANGTDLSWSRVASGALRLHIARPNGTEHPMLPTGRMGVRRVRPPGDSWVRSARETLRGSSTGRARRTPAAGTGAARSAAHPVAEVTTANLVGTSLQLTGRITRPPAKSAAKPPARPPAQPPAQPRATPLTVRVHTAGRAFSAMAEVRADTTFSVDIDLTTDIFGVRRSAPYGDYRLTVGDKHSAQPLHAADPLRSQLPVEVLSTQHRARFTCSTEGALRLRLSNPLDARTVGAFNQARLQRQYTAAALEPLDDTVYLHSYVGGEATDSALAIHRELHRRFPHWTLYWGVADWSVPLPEGATPVLINSRQWFDVISRARYLVNNVFFPRWFVKRPFQTYVQTWHGVPLKRIGHSYWEAKGHNPVWVSQYDAQAASWDYLISNSDYCTDRLRDEFRYTGEVLQTGYPRNDLLSRYDASLRRAIAQRVGIDPAKRIVMYAPTWRDSLSPRTWEAAMVDFLDARALAGDLGSDYVVAIRGHGHNARAGAQTRSAGGVVDLTRYPDITELLVLADLVITDYSSLLFDFAVTGKPMLFLAPDAARYAGGERGMYLDYEATVPGPVLSGQRGLADAVRAHTRADWQPDAQYRAFAQRFCAVEDGHAAERVVDAVWGSDASRRRAGCAASGDHPESGGRGEPEVACPR